MLPALITTADMVAFGYPDVAPAYLVRASTRVRGYTEQRISPDTSSRAFHAAGPWLLPERPVASVTSVVDRLGFPVPFELKNQTVHPRRCSHSPVTITWAHGFDPLPDGLVEAICDVAARLADTPKSLSAGVRTEQAGGEAITWGADAARYSAELTAAEKSKIDKYFPRLPRTTHLI